MKVQTRLSLYSSLVFGVVFATIAILIFGIYRSNTEKLIFRNLEQTANITALFYLEEDELNNEEFLKIKIQFNKLVNNSFYQLYNEHDSICYGSEYRPIPAEYLNNIRINESLSFAHDEFFCYGIFYRDNQGDFVVVAREKREEADKQTKLLLWILAIAFFTGMLSLILLSKWIANLAYRPFRKVIKQVKSISTHNLNVQLDTPQTQDELQDLIETFNSLLAKIADTFTIQQNFVRYVSHEFKTPLASMMGNVEVFSIKNRTPEEYKQLSSKLIQQILQLDEIINTLIAITDLRKSTDDFQPVRIDEMVWEIITKVSGQYSSSDIQIDIDVLPEDSKLLLVAKHRTQLLVALFNLIENAVKFSQGKAVNVRLYNQDRSVRLSIADKGIGIPPEKMKNISKPFYRAENANQILGSGIGLSIALRILEKNEIKYTIDSAVNIGTTITLFF